MHSRLLLGLPLAAALALTGCSESPAVDTASSPSDAAACPTAAPAQDAPVAWNFAGSTGSIAVIAPTDDTAPRVDVTTPFAVDVTTVHTLTPGEGKVIEATATVSVCYQGVNGRDGKIFDSAYQRGTPASFSLTGVVPGFTKAIAGQQVGSTVAVAVASADGYPQGQPAAGINPGDSLIFTISILSAQ